MEKWLSGVRGTFVLVFIWFIGWGVGFGGIMEAFVDPRGELVDIWPALMAAAGLFGGIVMAILLRITDARRGLHEVSPSRFAILGVVAGGAMGGLTVAIGLPNDIAIDTTTVRPMSPIVLLGILAGMGAVAGIGSSIFFRLVTRKPNAQRLPSSLSAIALLALAASTATAQTGPPLAERLDSIAGAGVREKRAIGMVAVVVRGDDTLLLQAYGQANIEWEVPMAADAMFEVGSIAKQFAAAAILQLKDQGKLSLDDPVTRWLPDLGPAGNTITLRRMLNHTSGIAQFGEMPGWEVNLFNPRFTRDSALRLVTLEPLQYPTGQAQAYSNSGFWLLGVVVEKASGMRYEDYLQQHIFEPLGMRRSMYCNSVANVPHRAHGYHMLPMGIRRPPTVNYTLVGGPGAVCSTAGDLVIWLQALHGGKVLSPESYAEMTTPAMLADGTRLQYGLGIKVGTDYRGLRYIGHGGTAPGFRANAAWYPDARMAVVVLMNTSPAPISPGDVGGELARAVLLEGPPDLRYFTGDATELVGTYRHVMGGNRPITIEVTSTPDGLAFAPAGRRPERLPWAGGLTFYAQEDVTLTFRRANGDSGPVTELRRDDAGNLYIMEKR